MSEAMAALAAAITALLTQPPEPPPPPEPVRLIWTIHCDGWDGYGLRTWQVDYAAALDPTCVTIHTNTIRLDR